MDNSCNTRPQPKTAKEFFRSRNFWKPVLATMLGALAGFLYYYYIGCSSGTCAITSNPFKSTAMGGFLGWFLVSSPCSKGKCQE